MESPEGRIHYAGSFSSFDGIIARGIAILRGGLGATAGKLAWETNQLFVVESIGSAAEKLRPIDSIIGNIGHEACGAVKGACDGAEIGNLTALLEKIQPAVEAMKGDFSEDKQNSKNLDFVNKVVEENVRITIADIHKDSPVLSEMEKGR